MASPRALQPLLRQASRAASLRLIPATTPAAAAAASARRLASTEASRPILYSAHAKVVGARVGHVQGDDLVADLTMAKALGGPGDKGKTNPEELFAAGYGACFQAAMNACAAREGIRMPSAREDSVVETTVHLVGDMRALDMTLAVDMRVRVKGLGKEELEKVVEMARGVCPYTRATEGNVVTNIEVVHSE